MLFLSDAVIRQLKMKNKPVDRDPKRFAAWVGFVLSVSILVFVALKQDLAVDALTVVMILFAFLEVFMAFCASCYGYTFALLLIKK